MRTISAAIVMLAALYACGRAPSAAGDSMTLEQILQKHTDARGGASAIENVRSLDIALEITEPTFKVTGHYRATRDGWMRIDIYDNETRVFTEALGPDGGWQMFANGAVEDLSAEGALALRHGVFSNLYGLHELEDLDYRLAYVGPTTRHDRALWELTVTAPEGKTQHLFLGQDDFLAHSEVETSALHPDVDSTQVRQETFYTDYKSYAGVLFSN
ncbi:MAG: hypothetical protein ACX939_07980, partial [Hyphococcus sp.]